MSILPLQISQRVLTGSDLNPIFSGAQNIDSIKVTFDAEWSGFAKTAVFSRTFTELLAIENEVAIEPIDSEELFKALDTMTPRQAMALVPILKGGGQ